MKYSFQIGKIIDIPILIHWSFALLLIYVFGNSWFQEHSIEEISLYLGLIFAIFSCILLHELGHAISARYFKVQTRMIVLLPIGGVAFFEKNNVSPLQEFFIAFAGPFTNLLIALLIFIGLKIYLPSSIEYIGIGDDLFSVGHKFFQHLMWLNVYIAVFNLIPAFPLDGGLILRSFLTGALGDRVKAIKVQFFISLFIASLFLIYSYQKRAPEYLFLSWLIYFSSRNEWKKVH